MKVASVLNELASHPAGTFLNVVEFNGAHLGACDITGVSPVWEMHPDTDELFYIIEGTFEVTLLSSDEPEHVVVPAGSTCAIPKGVWHKPGAPTGAKFMYLTPGKTLHSEADDPRKMILEQRPMVEPFSIRYAQITDLKLLLTLSINSFRDAFADENNTADIAAYLSETFSTEKLRAELESDRNTFLLLTLDNSSIPIGYAKLRDSQPEKGVNGPAPVELERLYLDSSVLRKGLGSKLMQASLDEAAKQGYKTLWLGVWEENRHALAFYKRWDFQTVGSHVFQLCAEAQNDLIMQRSI